MAFTLINFAQQNEIKMRFIRQMFILCDKYRILFGEISFFEWKFAHL